MELTKYVKPYRVTCDKFQLDNVDPGDTLDLDIGKAEAKQLLSKSVEMLSVLHEKLYAQDQWGVLVIFQGMDAAGKDSAIKHVMSGVNPQDAQYIASRPLLSMNSRAPGFVKQSGGIATIYSEIGRGTTVNLYPPRFVATKAAPSASAPDRPSRQVTERVDTPSRRQRGDRPHSRNSKRQKSISCSATSYARWLTGYELAARARALSPTIRILLTSGYDAELAAAQDTTMSSLKVLRKPYKQAELARALRDVLGD